MQRVIFLNITCWSFKTQIQKQMRFFNTQTIPFALNQYSVQLILFAHLNINVYCWPCHSDCLVVRFLKVNLMCSMKVFEFLNRNLSNMNNNLVSNKLSCHHCFLLNIFQLIWNQFSCIIDYFLKDPYISLQQPSISVYNQCFCYLDNRIYCCNKLALNRSLACLVFM